MNILGISPGRQRRSEVPRAHRPPALGAQD